MAKSKNAVAAESIVSTRVNKSELVRQYLPEYPDTMDKCNEQLAERIYIDHGVKVSPGHVGVVRWQENGGQPGEKGGKKKVNLAALVKLGEALAEDGSDPREALNVLAGHIAAIETAMRACEYTRLSDLAAAITALPGLLEEAREHAKLLTTFGA